ncbi:MAG: phosphopantothenoylcysteine decarboxylase [Verrucomicrobiae bacterium]|nr:phosphopantothenoylcysteine decarboxylase [Verrucomicrobiae bacterium]
MTRDTIFITTGPGYEPLDQVRRLTNFSTGKLGTGLGNFLADRGYRVICFAGETRTFREPNRAEAVVEFGTGRDLLDRLREWSGKESPRALFHVAALGDFQVADIHDAQGRKLEGAKIPSREGELVLRLKPAPKVIPHLRGLFPAARIVGWKYELEGDAARALRHAAEQIAENRTDACVVNGRAYGPGFGLVGAGDGCRHADGPGELYTLLESHLLARE